MKDAYPTQAEIRQMANDALAYLFSPEGQKKLREQNEEAARMVERFRQMRNISWERLHAPFTI